MPFHRNGTREGQRDTIVTSTNEVNGIGIETSGYGVIKAETGMALRRLANSGDGMEMDAIYTAPDLSPSLDEKGQEEEAQYEIV